MVNKMTFCERKRQRTEHYFTNVFGWKLGRCYACNGSGHYDSVGSPHCGCIDGRDWYQSQAAERDARVIAEENHGKE